jgi:hypothetical protein
MTGWLELPERGPDDVVVYDRTARRWMVRRSNSGLWIGLLRGPSPGSPGHQGNKLVTAFDATHARRMSDALEWAARVVDPRSPGPEWP